MNIEKIQAVLNVKILEVREWAYVYWVRPVSGRCTLVSKKAIALDPAVIEPLTFTLSGGRRGSRPWVARIDGLDAKYGFARTFIDADSIEWGRKGCDSATFTIADAVGYFQDTEGYWKLSVENNKITAHTCSYDEVKYVMRDRAAQHVAIAH